MFNAYRISGSRPESRNAKRVKLAPMYTLVRVKPAGAERFRWTGYVYDISATGMRFELDAPVDPGTRLDVKAMLPGPLTATIRAAGTVVRIHDDDQIPGPTRMGMSFDSFVEDDGIKLNEYLNAATPAAARAA